MSAPSQLPQGEQSELEQDTKAIADVRVQARLQAKDLTNSKLRGDVSRLKGEVSRLTAEVAALGSEYEALARGLPLVDFSLGIFCCAPSLAAPRRTGSGKGADLRKGM
jgi:hypothetical protein